MKKIIAVLLTLAVVAALGIVSFADTYDSRDTWTESTATESGDVTIKIESNSTAATVYYVETSWESLEFTYVFSDGVSVWNPETHAFEVTGATGGSWKDGRDASHVTVTNHSNAAVTVKARFGDQTTITSGGVTANLGTSDFTLASAVGTTIDNAPSNQVHIALTGSPTQGATDFTLGTVTVTITKA